MFRPECLPEPFRSVRFPKSAVLQCLHSKMNGFEIRNFLGCGVMR